MTFIDGDDALIGRQVFSVLNAIYQKYKPAVTYGQLLTLYHQENSIRLVKDFGYTVKLEDIKSGKYRKSNKFITRHLRTLYVDLFRKLKDSDFRFSNGSYINYATDTVIMKPVLQMVE